MKKILISLFSITLMIGMSNTVNACETCGCQDKNQEIKKECSSKVDLNTKAANSCCKGKKTKSSCNKSEAGSFNFNKSNNYAKKSSCCKGKTKKCSKKKATTEESTAEESTTEE